MVIDVNQLGRRSRDRFIPSANTALFPIPIPILRPSANSARVPARTPRDTPSGRQALHLPRLPFCFCPSPLERHRLPRRLLRLGRHPVAYYCVLRLTPPDWLPRV